MRSTRRYIILIFTVIIMIFVLINSHFHSVSKSSQPEQASKLVLNKLIRSLPFYWDKTSNGCPNLTYLNNNTDLKTKNLFQSESQDESVSHPQYLLDYIYSPRLISNFNFNNCQMSNCFDLSRCQSDGPIKINILPKYSTSTETSNETSLGESNIIHENILKLIRNSKYYEPDPDKACLFVLEDDTLDRDPLSKSFRQNVSTILQESNMYGMNHLVFNLYSGSWPDYKENDFSGLQFGAAIVAKASNSIMHHRKDFDISLPLFSYLMPYSSESGQSDNSYDGTCDTSCSFFLTFKGKRYVFGRGSDTRNNLYHIHNNRDVIMLTTCRHGKKWKHSSDKRCDNDELNYDKHDFVELMKNSTFCLVPRGRRLGSFRFIEALRYGCIPIVMSDGWVEPFGEIIDWSCSSIKFPEALLLHTPDLLRDLDQITILKMKQSCRTIYEKYFSSIEKIIMTVISIIEKRILALKVSASIKGHIPG